METTPTEESYSYQDYEDPYLFLQRARYIADVYLMVALSVVFLLGTIGNGLVIWFVVFKMKKTVSSVWFLNLALADFTFLLFQPLQVTYMALQGHWPFGDFMCKLQYFVLALNMFSSILQLTVISIDRWVCVVFPVWCQNHRTPRLALKVTLGIWILAFLCSAPFFIRVGTDTYSGLTICYERWFGPTDGLLLKGRVIMRFIIFFAVPFIIIVSCYTLVIFRIQRNRMVTSTKPFKMIAAVIMSFFIFWLPFHVTSLMLLSPFQSYYSWNVRIIALGISTSLACANSCINPFLYVFFGRNFEEKFWSSILPALRRAFTEDSDWTDSERHTVECRFSANHERVIELPLENIHLVSFQISHRST